MTNITEIIEKATKEYGVEQAWRNDRDDDVYCREDFKAGMERAVSDPSVLKELLGKFAEWQNKNYSQSVTNTGLWYGREGDTLNTEELISKYIQETIKPKENDG